MPIMLPGQRLLKRSVGPTSTVSLARLEAIAQALTHEDFTAPQSPEQRHPSLFFQRPTTALEDGKAFLNSRLFPPRLPPLLMERTNLLRRLDGALQRKLTLLQAPVGYGKTTTVNQWIVARRIEGTLPPVAWVSLDTEDNDAGRFWHTIITACLRRSNFPQSRWR